MFKIICDGISGDDGNLYRYFLSRDPNNDVPIEGANAFTYSYCFRMWNDIKVSHMFILILIPELYMLNNVILTGMMTEKYWWFQE